jgi:hypothetical protein
MAKSKELMDEEWARKIHGLIVEKKYPSAAHEVSQLEIQGFDPRDPNLLCQFRASLHELPSSENTADSEADEVKAMREFFERTLDFLHPFKTQKAKRSDQVANEEDPGDGNYQRSNYPFRNEALSDLDFFDGSSMGSIPQEISLPPSLLGTM